MTDVPADENPQPASGHPGPDRRQTIDLVRVERGEPERRRLPYRTGGAEDRRGAAADGSGDDDTE